MKVSNMIDSSPTTENYEKLEKLGEGTYGVVYKVKDKRTGAILALKKIRLENEQEGIPSTTIREISLLKSLKHPRIIDLIDVSYDKNRLFMIFEYVDMDLRKLLDDLYNQDEKLPDEVIKRISYQLISGISFCHCCGVLHRDIKPQNILINTNFDIKIADFGLGRSISVPLRTYSREIITLWYRGPELLLGCKYYAWSVDMWSIGCILAELILLQPIFPGDSEIDQLYRIFAILGTPNDRIWPNYSLMPKSTGKFPNFEPINLYESLGGPEDLIDLIYRFLVFNPVDRLPAKDALEHPYFQDYQDECTEDSGEDQPDMNVTALR